MPKRLIAYRGWRVMENKKGVNPMLYAVAWDKMYTGPARHDSDKPGFHESNGHYAVPLKHLEEAYQGYRCDALGRVSLYGTVIEHTRGYRAQRIVIDKLWVYSAAKFNDIFDDATPHDGLMSSTRQLWVVEQLASMYHCEVEPVFYMFQNGVIRLIKKQESEECMK